MEMHDIVRRLIGPVDPVGCHNTDTERYANLSTTIELVDLLLGDIRDVASQADRYEASVSKLGCLARGFLQEVYESHEPVVEANEEQGE